MAGIQGRLQILLDHQAAAGAVDDPHAFLAPGDRRRIDDPLGLVGHRGVQRDEVGARQQVFQVDLLHAEGHRAVLGQVGIEGDDPHLQALRTVGHDGADIAAADHAQGLAEQFDTHEARLLPLAGLGGGIGLRDLARQRHHHRDRMLGGRDGIAVGRVHHADAALRGGRDVDIVDADSGTTDHTQPVGMFQQGRRRLGG